MAQYRLTLDVPLSFPVERGFQQATAANNFRPVALSNMIVEPTSGLLMLTPSHLTANYAKDMEPLTSFRASPSLVQAFRDSAAATPATAQPANMMATTAQAGAGTKGKFTLIELLVDIAIIAILESLTSGDSLGWAAESNFLLAPDEGFALHYHGVGDELSRKSNWFAVQFDKYYFHFSAQGRVTVYQYTDSSLTTKNQIDQFSIGTSGDFIGKAGYFVFLPIPGVGLVIDHWTRGAIQNDQISSTTPGAKRGHLVLLPTTQDPNGFSTLTMASKLRIAINPYLGQNGHHIIGFQHLTYQGSGTYTSAVIDPGYLPTTTATAQAQTLPTAASAASPPVASLLSADVGAASTAYLPGTTRQVNVSIAATTSNPKYTPFIIGHGVTWPSVMATRLATPLVLQDQRGVTTVSDGAGNTTTSTAVDSLQTLEYTVDEWGRFEGVVSAIFASPAGIAIAERGDATFLLEGSQDGKNFGDSSKVWQTLFSGLAKEWHLEVNFIGGFYYLAKFALRDLWERFKETHICFENAFDSLTVYGACVNLLSAAGFDASTLNMLDTAVATTLPAPANGRTFRFAPKQDEDIGETFKKLLFYLTKEKYEVRLRYQYGSTDPLLGTIPAGWILEPRPYGTLPLWGFYPNSNHNSAISYTWGYDNLHLDPLPPEANMCRTEGLTYPTPSERTERIFSDELTDYDSLFTPTAKNYLGRSLLARIPVAEVSDLDQLNLINTRVFDRMRYRRFKGTFGVNTLLGISPNTELTLLDGSGNLYLDVWAKRVTVIAHVQDKETMTLAFDTAWESEMKG